MSCRHIYIFLLSILWLAQVSSQPIGTDLLDGEYSTKIPFKIKNGFIVVKLKFGGELPVNFIYDTGAEHTILFHKSYSDLLGIDYAQRIEIKGSDLNANQYALVARNVNLRLDNQIMVKRDVLILENFMELFQQSLGIDIDGVIGASFFRAMVVEIDYRKNFIKLYDPNRFKMKRKGYTTIDIDIRRNKPYMMASSVFNLNDTIKTKLLIDTGASIPFLLHANTDSALVIPEHVISGPIGQGITGQLEGFIGKIRGLQFGPYQFNGILTLFQDLPTHEDTSLVLTRNGIIGNDLLSRFSVIIHYLRGKLYLKPYKKKYNEDFDYDKSGMIIYAIGPELNQFYVKTVIPGTPAHEAGILPGDMIKRVGIWKDRFWTLEKLNNHLQKRDGKKIRMVIERYGVRIRKTFRLRDFFNDLP